MSTNAICQRRYEFALYPTADQSNYLHRQRVMMADLWNALLQRREELWRRSYAQKGVCHCATPVKMPTFFDWTKEITALRKELSEWAELSVWSAYGVAESLDLAFQAFYRRAKAGAGAQSGYPRYKRRADARTIPHRHNLPSGQKSGSGSGCKLIAVTERKREQKWALAVKGVPGTIRAKGRLPVEPDKFSAANIIWDQSRQRWTFSICATMPPRRRAGTIPLCINFDLLDCFATVNGTPQTLPELTRLQLEQERLDGLQSAHDKEWPRNRRYSDEQNMERRHSMRSIGRLWSYIARARRDALHVWTTRLVDQASEITIIAPKINEVTRSPHGDEHEWGAAIKTVSMLNRSVLSSAPALVVQMIKYKADEAGIRCDVVEDDTPKIAIGQDIIAHGREARRAKRQLKKERANELST